MHLLCCFSKRTSCTAAYYFPFLVEEWHNKLQSLLARTHVRHGKGILIEIVIQSSCLLVASAFLYSAVDAVHVYADELAVLRFGHASVGASFSLLTAHVGLGFRCHFTGMTVTVILVANVGNQVKGCGCGTKVKCAVSLRQPLYYRFKFRNVMGL